MSDSKIQFPQEIVKIEGLNPKLGIKSAFPKAKRNIALLYLLWVSNDEQAEYNFFETQNTPNNQQIKIQSKYLKNVFNHIQTRIHFDDGNVAKNFSYFQDELNNFELVTSQLEPLQVTFELYWPLAKFDFTDSDMPNSKERTGGNRYLKVIRYTSNIDLLKNAFVGQEEVFDDLLVQWITDDSVEWKLISESTDYSQKIKQANDKLSSLLSLLSDKTAFKLKENQKEIIFRKEGIYQALLKNNLPVSLGTGEIVGPLRIFQTAVKENLEAFLELKNRQVLLKDRADEKQIRSYLKRIQENIRLSKVNLDDSLVSQNSAVSNQKESFVGENIIYYGAPGTGKSYGVGEYIRSHGYPDYDSRKGNPYVFRVTLHPEYEYSDFVGQLMPIVKTNDKNPEQNNISYDFKEGIFTLALKKAHDEIENDNPHPIFLIMEEMSRANVAAVFGDLFQLLDRDVSGESEYAINNQFLSEKIFGNGENGMVTIPSNMTIIGTVNTSDQNVFVMDTAFKRRFEWHYVSTQSPANFDNNPELSIKGLNFTINWETFYSTLNDYIVNDLRLSEDKQIGPFFIKFSNLSNKNVNSTKTDDSVDTSEADNLIKEKLLQYLWDDVATVANMSSNKFLFNPKIRSFSELYDKYKNEKVFSDEFISKLIAHAPGVDYEENDR